MTVLTWGGILYLGCLIACVGWMLQAPIDLNDGEEMR